jgi:hypothetical protein
VGVLFQSLDLLFTLATEHLLGLAVLLGTRLLAESTLRTLVVVVALGDRAVDSGHDTRDGLGSGVKADKVASLGFLATLLVLLGHLLPSSTVLGLLAALSAHLTAVAGHSDGAGEGLDGRKAGQRSEVLGVDGREGYRAESGRNRDRRVNGGSRSGLGRGHGVLELGRDGRLIGVTGSQGASVRAVKRVAVYCQWATDAATYWKS